MMKPIFKMMTALFLLSLVNVLRSHARMLPAAGADGTFKLVKKEKEWMSMVVEQIITSSCFISNYRKGLPPPPPPPHPSPSKGHVILPTPQKPKMSDYGKTAKSPPPPPHPSPSKGHTILTTDPLKPKMSDYATIAKSPPPPPNASPAKGHVSSTILTPWMREGDLGKTPQSPPPTPNTSPAKDDSYIRSSGSTSEKDRRSLKSPPPRDVWMASTFIADC